MKFYKLPDYLLVVHKEFIMNNMGTYKGKSPAVVARAADLCGWKKTVSINMDGTLNWWGETGHPTDSEIDAKLSEAQDAHDAQASKREDGNGALGAPDEE